MALALSCIRLGIGIFSMQGLPHTIESLTCVYGVMGLTSYGFPCARSCGVVFEWMFLISLEFPLRVKDFQKRNLWIFL